MAIAAITAVDIDDLPDTLVVPAAIDALGISVDLAPGETREVTINAPAGDDESFCNVPGHAAAGMTGTLAVQ